MSDNERDPKGEAGAVGYGRPPQSGRFRRGRSGNPSGTPKGARNRPVAGGERLRGLLLKEAYRPIKVTADGTEVTMPLAQAVLRSLSVAAAKGEARAQAIFFKLVSAGEIEEAEMLAEQREKAAAEEPVEIEFHIVDEQGRRTGEVHRLSELSPGPKGGKDK